MFSFGQGRENWVAVRLGCHASSGELYPSAGRDDAQCVREDRKAVLASEITIGADGEDTRSRDGRGRHVDHQYAVACVDEPTDVACGIGLGPQCSIKQHDVDWAAPSLQQLVNRYICLKIFLLRRHSRRRNVDVGHRHVSLLSRYLICDAVISGDDPALNSVITAGP
jgi:hypothetical protein